MTFKRQIVDAFVKQSRDAGYKSRAAYKLLDLQDRFRIIKPGNSVLDLGCSPGSFLQVACQALGPRDRQGVVLGLDLTEVDVSKLKHCDGRAFAVQADASVLLTNDPLTMERFHRALPAPARTALQRGFDVVLSDMCHSTGGVLDGEKSSALAFLAARIALGSRLDPAASPSSDSHPLAAPTSSAQLLDRIRSGASTVQVKGGEAAARRVVLPAAAPVPESVSKNTPETAEHVLSMTARRPLIVKGGRFVAKVLQGEGTEELAEKLRPHFAKLQLYRSTATRAESREHFLIGIVANV